MMYHLSIKNRQHTMKIILLSIFTVIQITMFVLCYFGVVSIFISFIPLIILFSLVALISLGILILNFLMDFNEDDDFLKFKEEDFNDED